VLSNLIRYRELIIIRRVVVMLKSMTIDFQCCNLLKPPRGMMCDKDGLHAASAVRDVAGR